MAYKRKSYKRRYVKRNKSTKKAKLSLPMRKAVKSIVRGNIETKQYWTSDRNTNGFLIGNITNPFDTSPPGTVVVQAPLRNIVQGTQDDQRVGDQINLGTITLTAQITTLSVDTVQVRAIMYRITKPAFTGSTGAEPYNNLFKNQTNNAMINEPDREKITVLAHKRFTIQPTNGQTGNTTTNYKYTRLTLSHNFKYSKYQYEDGSAKGKKGEICLAIFSDTTPLAFMNQNQCRVTYKDA